MVSLFLMTERGFLPARVDMAPLSRARTVITDLVDEIGVEERVHGEALEDVGDLWADTAVEHRRRKATRGRNAHMVKVSRCCAIDGFMDSP
ncbi:uncharacterized protein J3R85_007155 [Psidium guajava]|nr:uncharacterized protein J3R85_007155 [Psidium guajava]